VLVLPLLLSSLNALRVTNCSFVAGLTFFLLLPVSTAVYAAAAGALAALAAPRRGRLIAILLPAISMAWALARLYLDPPVFAYDPFGGYFPGPIYDEALRPPATLALFRLVNLVWIGTAVTLAVASAGGAAEASGGAPAGGADAVPGPAPGPPRLSFAVRRWRPGPALAAAVLLGASAALYAHRGSLGFHVQRGDLLRVLDGERRSTRVVLRYVSAGADAADLDLAAQDLEFRYDQLREILGVEPRTPVTVYRFSDAEQKKALVGAGNTLYARPWTQEIFVQAEPFPSGVLRHEMAHVFAGAFGDRLFGVSLTVRFWGPLPLPRLASGLVEGIAVAADYTDPDGGSTVHQEAAAIVADGRAPPLAEVVGAGFSTLSGPRAYTLAGSFCHFLLQRWGAEKLRALYRSAGDFEGVYGIPLAALETEWRQFLGTQKLSAEQRARARERFRRPAIFKKVCAREQAARVAEARSLIRAEPARAVRILETACGADPHEPTIKVDLAEAYAAAGDTTRALDQLAAVGRDGDATEPVRARAAAVAASIHLHRGDADNARAALRQVQGSASDEGERRLATAKLRSLDGESARRTLGRALFGDGVAAAPDPVLTFFLMSEFARLHPDEALGPYLVGRQLATRDPPQALRFLRAACELPAAGKPLPPDFRRECLRLTVLAAFRAGDLARSQAAATALRDDTEGVEEAERLRAGDFLARIAWRAAKE
jgi:hypothetical protein